MADVILNEQNESNTPADVVKVDESSVIPSPQSIEPEVTPEDIAYVEPEGAALPDIITQAASENIKDSEQVQEVETPSTGPNDQNPSLLTIPLIKTEQDVGDETSENASDPQVIDAVALESASDPEVRGVPFGPIDQREPNLSVKKDEVVKNFETLSDSESTYFTDITELSDPGKVVKDTVKEAPQIHEAQIKVNKKSVEECKHTDVGASGKTSARKRWRVLSAKLGIGSKKKATGSVNYKALTNEPTEASKTGTIDSTKSIDTSKMSFKKKVTKLFN